MKAAIYARVSTEDQAEAQTIENQLEFARRYCELHEIPIFDFYRDDGISGTTALQQRPGGARLLNDASIGKFDLVLFYRLDRLARSTLHLLNAHDQLARHSVKLRSMTEPFDTSTGIGTFVMTLLGSIAALERDTILERTALGKERRARSGKWHGGMPPYGYGVDHEGYLEPQPDEADVVRLIFRLYTQERLGTVAIADYLDATGVPTAYRSKVSRVKTTGRWYAGTVAKYLRNPIYKGIYQYFKHSEREHEPITATVPAVISEETWELARERSRKNYTGARRNSRREYLLKSLIKCGACGCTYVGEAHQMRGREYRYYRCTNHSGPVGKLHPKCSSPGIRAERVEDVIWADIQRFVEDPGAVIVLLEKKIGEESQRSLPIDDERRGTQAALATKQTEREKVISLFRKGFISESEVQSELQSLEAETVALERRLDVLSRAHAQHDLLLARTVAARTLLEQLREQVHNADFATKRDLVEALVDKVQVDVVEQDGKAVPRITVTYCFDGNYSDCSYAVIQPSTPIPSRERRPWLLRSTSSWATGHREWCSCPPAMAASSAVSPADSAISRCSGSSSGFPVSSPSRQRDRTPSREHWSGRGQSGPSRRIL